jgi:crotonobetainyl-CoA:carnitine CoA-transferase CaiB-like acyl-CoA transferase
VLSVTGTEEQPVKSGISVVDISAGMYALSAILAALYQRRDTGVGATIRVSLFDSIMEWMQPLAMQAMSDRPPRRAGDRHASIVPYGPYRVANDRRVMFAIQNEREWARLCSEVLAGVSVDEAEARLDTASLAFARANEARDVFDHPQVRGRGRTLQADSPVGPLELLRAPFNIDGITERDLPIPSVGEQTDDILRTLGYEAPAIESMRRDGVI